MRTVKTAIAALSGFTAGLAAALAIVLTTAPEEIRFGTSPAEDSEIAFDAGRVDYRDGVWFVVLP